MVTMLIISLLLAAALPAAAIWMFREIPKSISSLAYRLPEGGWRWLWSLWLMLVTVTLAPALMEATPDMWRIFAFATLACLTGTAAIPSFTKGYEGVHDYLSLASGIFSQACVRFICPWWLAAWAVTGVLSFGVLCGFKDKGVTMLDGRGVTLAEATCMVTVFGSVLTALL